MPTPKLEEILTFLNNNKCSFASQPETGQIFELKKIQGREFPLFLRITDNDFLQILLFLPYKIHPGKMADLARLLHMLNREMEVPGFGIDEQAEISFYRIMIPPIKKEINGDLLKHYVGSLDAICKDYAPVVEAVLSGAMSLDELVQKAKEPNAKEPSK